ncbi:hypothetical protein [uncultured Bacteroides sp.]|uniref:hypothetical protein n=1 Tax=uncultured Bacteroides sp. TaxID=162156 RepID=UPI00262AD05E|nr:hypothetical protein [uncultured Bacteroides sp.]
MAFARHYLRAISVPPPYLLRTIFIVIVIGLVRSWYGADTELTDCETVDSEKGMDILG